MPAFLAANIVPTAEISTSGLAEGGEAVLVLSPTSVKIESSRGAFLNDRPSHPIFEFALDYRRTVPTHLDFIDPVVCCWIFTENIIAGRTWKNILIITILFMVN